MNWRTERSIAAVLLTAALVSVTGCAVTEIDVDVYKGPLVNDPGVQIEQTAALAIGAKPLLTQLRDGLEWPDRQLPADSKEWYRSGFIDEEHLTKPQALRVNAVLSLYEDQDAGRLGELREEAEAVFQRLDRALARIRPPTAGGSNGGGGAEGLDAAHWERIKKKFIQNPNPVLVEAYQEFFLGQLLTTREGGKTEHWRGRAILTSRQGTIRGGNTGDIDIPQEAISTFSQPKAENFESNWYFLALENPANVRSDAEALFGQGDSEEKELFIHDVTDIATNFRVARQHIVRLFELCLQTIEEVNLPDAGHGGADARRLTHAGADLASRLIGVFKLHRAFSATAQFNLPSRLGLEFRDALLSRLPPKQAAAMADPKADWRDDTPEADIVRDAIRTLLVDKPVRYAQALREINALHTNPRAMTDPPANKPELKGSQYGIVRGPTESASRAIDLAGLQQAWRKWISVLRQASGFEAGRLPEGIDSLIQAYVAAIAKHPTDPDAGREELERLLIALTHFSEKVLFVANNSQLIPDLEGGGQNPQAESYGRLLEAVGNSLLVMIDEFRHRRRAEMNASGGGDEEAAIIDSVTEDRPFPTTAPTTLPGLARGLSVRDLTTQPASQPATQPTTRPATQPSPRTRGQAIERLRSKLFYDYAQLVKVRGEADPLAQNYKQALDLVYEHRADAVFIRPPSAYLRNSYPVTSLQNDPKLRWRNMLSEQNAKAMPFYEGFRDLVDPKSAKDAKVVAAIDKTFWQNINRVRVVGSGRTNYVIVKDDIGNWYVKGYSANPVDLIRAAQSMASFAAGVPVSSIPLEQAKGLNLQEAKKARDATTQPAAQEPAPSAAATTVRRQQYDQSVTAYEDRARTLNGRVATAAATLKDNVDTAFSTAGFTGNTLDALKSASKAAADSSLTGPTTQPAPTTPSGAAAMVDATVKSLTAIRDFHKALSGQIPKVKFKGTDDTETTLSADDAKKATTALDEVIRKNVQPLIQEGIDSADRHTTELNLVSRPSGQ